MIGNLRDSTKKLDTQVIICIVIFVLTLISYILNKIPMWITSCISLGALYITGCMTAEEPMSGFSNTNIILMSSMFMVASGFQRSSFVKKICDTVMRLAGGSFTKAFAANIILAVILTNLISSPVATFGVVAPLLAALCDSTGVSRSKVMFPAMVVCVGCFGLLPFASAVQQASQAAAFLETYGFTETIAATDYFFGKAPMLLLPLWAIFLGPKVSPANAVVPMGDVAAGAKRDQKPLTPFQDKAAVVIFFADILVIVFSAQLGLETWFVAAVGAMLMVCTGVLDHRNALKAIPLDMILLTVGALGLGTALTATGAGQVVGDWLSTIVGGNANNYVLGALFFLIPFIVTQFMLNRAVNQIFTPICLLTCQSLGANPIGLLLLVSAGSLTAFLTPMATPAVAMCMKEGGYDLKSIFKSGAVITVLLSVVYIFYTMTVYPAF